MFNKPQIKANDRSALQEFHQQIKPNITWLSSLRYITPLYSNDSMTKAILCLPFHLRKEFYKHTKDASLTDGIYRLSIHIYRLSQLLFQTSQGLLEPMHC